MGRTGSEEAAQHDSDRKGIDPVIANEVARGAERDVASGDHPDEREDRVPREAQRSDVKVRIEWEVDQTAKLREWARLREVSRMIIGTAAAATRMAMT